MNIRSGMIALACALAATPAYAQTREEIAKAYVQAVTGGSGPKAAGSFDFDSLGCGPATVFVQGKCQTVLRDGKDGKAMLMEAITAANIEDLVPTDDLKRVYADLNDKTYDDVRGLFGYLSTAGDGWFPAQEGPGKAKAILQAHLHSLGPGGMYGYFDWPFDAADAAQAKITSAGVDFNAKQLPAAADLSVAQEPLYFWAFQTDMSNMAYPPGVAYPTLPGKPADACANTKAAWGHVGFQYSKNDPATPNSTQQRANWGGGGDGSGVGDYGCGGSDVTDTPIKENTWYEYRVTRGAQRGAELWDWEGAIYEKGVAAPVYKYTIFGGEYIVGATTWLEPIYVRCADAKNETRWANPWVANGTGKFRVGRVSFVYGNDACLRSRESVLDRCDAKWSQEQGANQPVTPARFVDLRGDNGGKLVETDCARAADSTEIAIAAAYVEAISGGAAKAVSGAVDFARLGCIENTVFGPDNCQKAVFNGKDGKTVMMEAISTASNGDWRTSNIERMIPQASMRRIMTDPRYAQAKSIFGYMSDAGNNWYSGLAGAGQAKEVLRNYMNAMK